jgi:hypothetical protein
MSDTLYCGNRELLVAYLYEDGEARERAAMHAHVAQCQECADELLNLTETRRLLTEWAPPEASLGFRLPEQDGGGAGPSDSRPVGRVVWWRQPLPAWAQVAAALVIFVAGVAAGGARGPNTTGTTAPNSTATTARAEAAALEAAVAALDARVRGIERTALAVPPPGGDAGPAPVPIVDPMPRVRSEMAAFEQRIRADLATREEVARGLIDLKNEETQVLQQFRDYIDTRLNDQARAVWTSLRAEE